MLNLYKLEQFVSFAELGTLSRVAEKFHISTPSITCSMQHLEESFGVPLFFRGKNRIKLNDTGCFAVEYARKLLADAKQTIDQVQAFDARCKTIVIRSCAPAPLWSLLPKLNAEQPGMMVSSVICQNDEVLAALKDGSCDIGILPFPLENGCEFMQENLFVCRRSMSLHIMKALLSKKSTVLISCSVQNQCGVFSTRVNIPLSDDEAHVTFYITKYSPSI